MALNAKVTSFLDVVAIAPELRLERTLADLATSHHLSDIDEWAAWMPSEPKTGMTHSELLDALIPEGKP
jgi:hypothetical protein